MPHILNAIDCPIPQSLGSLSNLVSAGVTEALYDFTDGAAEKMKGALRALSVALENAFQFPSGLCAVARAADFTLSAGSGLTCNIAAGTALMGTIVEYAGGSSTMISSSRSFLWIDKTGSIHVTSTKTPPSGLTCFIGSVLSGSSTITSVDTSGVVYCRGCLFYRKTNDSGVPGDAPPSDVSFVTSTAAHTYLWDGDGYYLTLDGSSPLPTNYVVEAITGTKNGTNPTFTISNTRKANTLVIWLNGKTYFEGVDFTFAVVTSVNTITWTNMTEFPDTGDSFMAGYQY